MRTPSDLPNTDSANTEYPHGRLRDDLLPGDGTGTPVRSDWQSDLYYGHLELLDRAGIVPNHAAETATSNQFADAIETIIDNRTDYLKDFRTWDSTRTYSLNDPVFYNGVPYKSLQNSNTNQNPATAPTYWEVTGSGGGGGINFVKNPLTKANTTSWTRSSGSLTWDTTYNLYDGGALYAASFTGGQIIDGELNTVQPVFGGQSWKIEIGYRIDSNSFTDGELTLVLYDGANEISGGNIPIVTGQVNTVPVFVYPSITLSNLKVRVKATNAAHNCAFRLANVSVAPAQPVMMPAVSGWIPYIPTITNGGTELVKRGFWRRIGDSIQLQVYAGFSAPGPNATVLVSIPSGITIDYNKLGGAAGYSGNAIGSAQWYNGSGQINTIGVYPNNETTVVFFKNQSISNLVGTDLPNASELGLSVTIPIAQWSNSIQVSGESVQYISHDGTNVVYGPSGSLMPDVPLGTQASFEIPKKASDLVSDYTIQIVTPTNGVLTGRFNFMYQSIKSYGIGLSDLSSTTLRVIFGDGGAQATGATYGANALPGDAWNLYRAAGWRWRLVKRNGGSMAEVPPVVRAEYNNQVTTSVDANLRYTNVVADTHIGYDTTTGRYYFRQSGIYLLIFSTQNSGAGTGLLYYKINGGANELIGEAPAGLFARFSETLKVNAGDYIAILQSGSAPAAQTAAKFEVVYLGKF